MTFFEFIISAEELREDSQTRPTYYLQRLSFSLEYAEDIPFAEKYSV